jgi:hypothetical protein
LVAKVVRWLLVFPAGLAIYAAGILIGTLAQAIVHQLIRLATAFTQISPLAAINPLFILIDRLPVSSI